MTSIRLRQIAQLIELQCIELRTLKRFPDRVACNQCKAAVVELCALAREADRQVREAQEAIRELETALDAAEMKKPTEVIQ